MGRSVQTQLCSAQTQFVCTAVCSGTLRRLDCLFTEGHMPLRSVYHMLMCAFQVTPAGVHLYCLGPTQRGRPAITTAAAHAGTTDPKAWPC